MKKYIKNKIVCIRLILFCLIFSTTNAIIGSNDVTTEQIPLSVLRSSIRNASLYIQSTILPKIQKPFIGKLTDGQIESIKATLFFMPFFLPFTKNFYTSLQISLGVNGFLTSISRGQIEARDITALGTPLFLLLKTSASLNQQIKNPKHIDEFMEEVFCWNVLSASATSAIICGLNAIFAPSFYLRKIKTIYFNESEIEKNIENLKKDLATQEKLSLEIEKIRFLQSHKKNYSEPIQMVLSEVIAAERLLKNLKTDDPQEFDNAIDTIIKEDKRRDAWWYLCGMLFNSTSKTMTSRINVLIKEKNKLERALWPNPVLLQTVNEALDLSVDLQNKHIDDCTPEVAKKIIEEYIKENDNCCEIYLHKLESFYIWLQ